MKLPSLLLGLGCSGSLLLSVSASPLGFDTDPAGSAWNRYDLNTGFALWDALPGTSYSNDAPDSAFGIASPEANQSLPFTNFNQGAGLYNVSTGLPATGSGDVIFTGGNSVSFTFSGTVSFTIRGVIFQAKRAGSASGLADASGFAPMLSLNGGAPIPADGIVPVSGSGTSGDTSSDSGAYSVTSWYWGSSLAGFTEGSANTFTITASKTSMQRSLDGFSVDLGSQTVIPEPASAGLLALGLVGMLAWRPGAVGAIRSNSMTMARKRQVGDSH